MMWSVSFHRDLYAVCKCTMFC